MELKLESQETLEKIIDSNIYVIGTGDTLDNNNAFEMVQIITNAHANGFKFVLIDMSKLEFLSSAGVGSILGTVENFRENNGDIILCDVPDPIVHILNILDLEDYFTIKSNIQNVINEIKSS